MDDALAAFCGAPQAVDVEGVGAVAGDGDFEKSLPLGGFKKYALFLSKSMADAAATDLCLARLATAESLDIVFGGAWH